MRQNTKSNTIKKLKKLVIVLTDGESDDAGKVRTLAREFREKGAVVIGVGITKDGASAEVTYAPDGLVCDNASSIASVLAELLKKHINELNKS